MEYIYEYFLEIVLCKFARNGLTNWKTFLTNILKNIIWHLFAGESHQVLKITVTLCIYEEYITPEPVFVDLLRSFDSQLGRIDSLESNPGLLKRLQIQVHFSKSLISRYGYIQFFYSRNLSHMLAELTPSWSPDTQVFTQKKFSQLSKTLRQVIYSLSFTHPLYAPLSKLSGSLYIFSFCVLCSMSRNSHPTFFVSFYSLNISPSHTLSFWSIFLFSSLFLF